LFGEFKEKSDEKKLLSSSKSNPGETELVFLIFMILTNHYKINSSDIGIITPYSSQVESIKRLFH